MKTARALAWGGLTVAAAEAIETSTFWWFYRGVTPGRIFQFVAAGLLGAPAFERSSAVWLGVALHFFIAFVIVAVYILASRRYPGLVRRPAAWGLVYGAAVHCVMQFVVIPLSAAPHGQRWNPLVLAHGFLSQAVTVGLPSAYFAKAARRP